MKFVSDENSRKWRVPSLLYVDDLVLWSEFDNNVRLVDRFDYVCKRRNLKV